MLHYPDILHMTPNKADFIIYIVAQVSYVAHGPIFVGGVFVLFVFVCLFLWVFSLPRSFLKFRNSIQYYSMQWSIIIVMHIITHKPLLAAIPSYLQNDIWALKMLKCANFIHVGPSQTKSHFVEMVTYEYDMNILCIAITNMIGKYVPKSVGLFLRSHKIK